MESLLDGRVMLHAGDCIEAMRALPANSVDACVTDPPYHLTSIVERFGTDNAATAQHGTDGAFARASRGFMGKVWDGGDIAFRPEVWREVLRVLKPGGHLLAFGATRGFGRMQVAIEDAGFETRDCILDIIDADPRIAAFVNSLNDAQRCAFLQIVVEGSDVGGLMAWMFGTGFPKNHNVALDYEKRLCAEGKDAAGRTVWRYADGEMMARSAPFRHPLAQRYAGFGTALKPAFEPIVMARKPLADGSVAANVEAWGVGAINIDAARIAVGPGRTSSDVCAYVPNHKNKVYGAGLGGGVHNKHEGGRYPANVIHDGSDIVVAAFPQSAGAQGNVSGDEPSDCHSGVYSGPRHRLAMAKRGDAGSSARFFYSAKADADDRIGSKHPTVKPVDLMQYLVRMVTSPGDTVLDCFAGTGTTGEAAFREGRNAILIERDDEYRADIRRRMALAMAGPDERKRESIKAKVDHASLDLGPLFGGSDTPPPRWSQNLR